MTPLPTEVDDPARLQAVVDLELVGAPRAERFDRITRTAQRLLGSRFAFLNLVDAATLWVTSCVGFDGREVDRDIAFCSHAISSTRPMLVPDTTRDPRFRDNPLVVADPHIRSYAGRPLRGPSGALVGTLCVMDVVPRDWTPEEVAALDDLAAWAESELAAGGIVRRLDEGQRLRRLHAQALASAGQGILGLDPDGLVVVANPEAGRLVGVDPDALLGRPLHAALHGQRCHDEHCPLAVGLTGGLAAARSRALLLRDDGQDLPVQLSLAPLADGATGRGAVVVLDDLAAEQAVDRMKDEFISVVSHELRTPLTSLRGALGLLAAGVLGELSEQGRRMADVAVASTERLVRLVDDILDLERLLGGQVVLERRTHPLASLASDAVAQVSPVADDAGVQLRVTAGPGTGWCDGPRVVQVLAHLLGNAVAVSAPGEVVDLRLQPDGDHLLLEVQDRGTGIEAAELERVFDRFTRVDSSDTRRSGGTGIGLALARVVAEAHGGSISAASTPGRGTTFRVRLPQRRDDSAPQPAGRRGSDAA